MAADNELLIRLGVDSSSVSKQLSAVKNELKTLNSQMKLVNDSTDDYNKSAEGLTKKLALQEKALKAYQTQLELEERQLQDNVTALEKRKQKLAALEGAEEKNTKEIKKAQDAVAQYTNKVEDSKNKIETTTLKMESMTRAINSTSDELTSLNNSVEDTTKDLQSMNKVLDEQNSTISKMNYDELADKFQAISDASGLLADTIMPMSLAIGAGLTASAKTAMDFETAITQVAVTAQTTDEELEQLKESALRLGEELPLSASAVAEGFNFLALAGYNVEQQLGAIEPIAKASVAWNADLATVSDLATDSLSAMGLTVDDLGRYMDVASQAQSKSNTTATALMEAYVGVGGVLKGLNIPLEESASWLGVLANRGVKGSEAGNALSAVLINLTSGSGQAGTALQELGISAFDTEGNFKGLETILSELDTALAGCTEEQRNTYLAMIGGKEHISDLNALIDGLRNEYGDLKGNMEEASGVLDRMTEQMGSTTAMKVEELMGKLESLAIKIGEMLLPHIENLVDWVSKLVDWFGSLDQSTQESILKWGALVTALAPVLSIFSNFTGKISDFISVFGTFGDLFGKTSKVLTTGGTSMQTLAETAGGLTKTITGSGGLITAFSTLASTAGAWALGGAVATMVIAGFQAITEYMGRTAEVADLVKQGLRGDEISNYYEGAASANESHTERAKDSLSRLENEALPHWAAYVAGVTEGAGDVAAAFEKMFGEEYELYNQELIDQMNDQIAHLEVLRNTGVISEEEYQRRLTEITTTGYQERKDAIDNAYQNMFEVMEKAGLIGTAIEDENGMMRTYTAEEWNREYALAQQQLYTAKNNIIEQGENEGLNLLERYTSEGLTLTKEQFDAIEKATNEWHEKETNANQEYYQNLIDDVEEYGAAYLGVTEMTDEEYIQHLKDTRDKAQAEIDGQHNDILTKADEACDEINKYTKEGIDDIFNYAGEVGSTASDLVSTGTDEMVYVYGQGWVKLASTPSESGFEESLQITTENGVTLFKESVEELPTSMQTSLDNVGNAINGTSYVDPVNGLVSTIYGTFETGMIDTTTLVGTSMGEIGTTLSNTDLKTPTDTVFGGIRTSAEETFMGLPIITSTGLGGVGEAISTSDLTTSSNTLFGQVTTSAQTTFDGIPTIAAVGLGAGALLIQGFDFLTPALAAFGLIPDAAEKTMPEANTNLNTGLDNMSTSIQNWDTAQAMSMPSEAFMASVNNLMSDSNIATQDGLDEMNISIQTAPFEETMDQQGQLMNNSLTNTYNELNIVTDDGMTQMDTTIQNTPFQESFITQGNKMVSAQESTMSTLQSTTQSGMSKLLGIVQETWGSIVSWWNSQNLSDKNVNVNVRTNYTSTGSPSTYSAGVGVDTYSLRSDDSSPFSNWANSLGYETRDYNVTIPSTFSDFYGVEVPQVNVLGRGESIPTYDLSSLDKKLDTLIEVLSNKENGNTTFTIEEMNVRTDQDIRNIARELDALRKIQARGRGES